MSKITSAEIPQLYTRLEKAVKDAKKKKAKDVEFTDFRFIRPYLNLDYVDICPNDRDDPDNGGRPSVVDQLLSCFLGGQSEHLFVTQERSVAIDPNADPVDRELATRCCALVPYYSLLAKFVEDNYFVSCGRVHNALASGIGNVIQDYQGFIVALEKQHRKENLTLYGLWYQIQEITELMRILALLITDVLKNNTRGASTLAKIDDFTSRLAVQNIGKDICIALTSEAAAPFMESVQKWVFNGEIYDPYDEFMVIEYVTSKDEYKKVEDYWEKKYQLRNACVPPFLTHLEIQILNSGKYLNVIKECVSSERDFKLAPIKKLVYHPDERHKIGGYAHIINEAYIHASKQLLSYMLNEYKIQERIKSLKRYFLLEQGDFVVTLLDTCDGELSKETSDILPSRLTTLVEMAIRIPSTNDDNYRDEIRMSLQKLTLSEQINKILDRGDETYKSSEQFNTLSNEKSNEIGQSSEKHEMTGYESFTLHVDCKWPISLVFHSKVLSSYQMLFRHLFYCKYIERILCRVWLLNQPIRGLPFIESHTYAPAHALRYKMMKFIENVEYYMMEVVIEIHWVEFMQKFNTVPNIDELIAEHWTFLDRSLKDCFLGDIELFKIFREILLCCLEFGTFIIRMRKFHMEADSDMTDSESSQMEDVRCLTESKKYPTFSQRVDQLSMEFETKLEQFSSALKTVSANDTSTKLMKMYFRLKPFFTKAEEEAS